MQHIIVDLETGGTNPDKHSLLDIAFIKTTSGFTPIKDIHVRIRHDNFVVTYEALQKNNVDLRDAGSWMNVAAAKKALFKFLDVPENIGQDGVRSPNLYKLVGTNVMFDVGFLKAFFGEVVYGKVFHSRPIEITNNFQHLQTVGLIANTKGYALSDMAEALGVVLDANNDGGGMYDAEIAVKIAKRMHKRTTLLQKIVSKYVERKGGLKKALDTV